MMKTLIALLLMTTAASAADGVTIAAIHTVDRAMCGLYVPQATIDAALVQGMRERHITFDQSTEAALITAQALLTEVTPYRDKWCDYRTKKD